MSKKNKPLSGYKEYTPNNDFDWSIYEDGYVGGGHLVPNKKVKTKPGEVCYCHESYAQDLYDSMEKFSQGRIFAPKDLRVGAIYTIDDIYVLSDHEIMINSNNGTSSVVDLNKESQLIRMYGSNSIKEFIDDILTADGKKRFIDLNVCAKVVDNGRVSIWDGYCAKIESEFFNELYNKNSVPKSYKAKIISMNNGGYTVDIMGVNCFLPSSLAASGPINDYESLLGKEEMVCVVNYSQQTKNFVVSHKKYLESTLVSRINDELFVGKDVFVKVTGITKNGMFCAIKDKNGDYVFSSLMHRSTMSPDIEASFDRKEFMIGDLFKAFVHKINWISDKECRIVIGDKAPVIEKENSEDNGRD